MPYIKLEDRFKFVEALERLPEITTAGELNYLITSLAIRYMDKGQNYQNYNDVMGALEGAKLELYRREVAPYEDTKITQNGDVY